MPLKILTRGLLSLMMVIMLGRVVLANQVSVEGAEAVQQPDGSYRFSVTLLHADNGWEHYADRWQVLSPKGKVLATRVLLHPHDNEQPFTRGMSGVVIPEGLKWVNIRGHDNVHGNGPKLFRIELPGR